MKYIKCRCTLIMLMNTCIFIFRELPTYSLVKATYLEPVFLGEPIACWRVLLCSGSNPGTYNSSLCEKLDGS